MRGSLRIERRYEHVEPEVELVAVQQQRVPDVLLQNHLPFTNDFRNHGGPDTTPPILPPG